MNFIRKTTIDFSGQSSIRSNASQSPIGSLSELLDDIFPKVIRNIIEYYKLEPDSQVYSNMNNVVKEYKSEIIIEERNNKFICISTKISMYNFRRYGGIVRDKYGIPVVVNNGYITTKYG